MSERNQTATAQQSLAEKLRTDAVAIFGESQADRDIIEWFYGVMLAAARAAPAAQDQGEAVEVVGFVTLGGIFHGGSGPELGDIDIEPDIGALERLQCKVVDSSEDVYLDLMTVAQHQRIVAQRDAELEFETGRYIELCLEHKALKGQLAQRDAKLAGLMEALEHIKAMQLRGFIVLGEKANGLMKAALSAAGMDVGGE